MDTYNLKKDFNAKCLSHYILAVIADKYSTQDLKDITLYGSTKTLSTVFSWNSNARIKITPPEKVKDLYHFTFVVDSGVGVKLRYDDLLADDELRVVAKPSLPIE